MRAKPMRSLCSLSSSGSCPISTCNHHHDECIDDGVDGVGGGDGSDNDDNDLLVAGLQSACPISTSRRNLCFCHLVLIMMLMMPIQVIAHGFSVIIVIVIIIIDVFIRLIPVSKDYPRENLLVALKSSVWSGELLVRLFRPSIAVLRLLRSSPSHNVVHDFPSRGESHLKKISFGAALYDLV